MKEKEAVKDYKCNFIDRKANALLKYYFLIFLYKIDVNTKTIKRAILRLDLTFPREEEGIVSNCANLNGIVRRGVI